jgi:glycosyltransferase involved in cell wall biosynthesis
VHDGVHGRIVPMGKTDRLLAAIEASFADRSGTRAMAQRARQRVEGDLSFEARVRRVESIYEEVAGHA